MTGTQTLAQAIRDADADELSERFGAVLTKARENHRIEGHIAMLFNVDDGEITDPNYIVMKQGVRVSPDIRQKYDECVEIPTDAFLSYEDVRQAVLTAIT